MEPADNQQEGGSVPKGGEPHPVLLLFAPFGTIRECISYPQVSFPSVIPPAVIHIRPLRGRQDATYETSVKYIHTLCLRMLVEQWQLEVHNTHPVGH